MTDTKQTTHFASEESAPGDAVCGAQLGDGERVTSQIEETTCPDCLVEPEALASLAQLETEARSLRDDFDELVDYAELERPAVAPDAAVAMLETVSSQLVDLHARIGSVFEDKHADGHYALEQVQTRLEVLLGVLGVPLPPAALAPDAVHCPHCGARLAFDQWGVQGDAWRVEQIRLHVADCEAAAGKAAV